MLLKKNLYFIDILYIIFGRFFFKNKKKIEKKF